MVSARAGNASPKKAQHTHLRGLLLQVSGTSVLIGNFSTANSKDRVKLLEGFVEGRSCNDLDWASLANLLDSLKLPGRDLCLA